MTYTTRALLATAVAVAVLSMLFILFRPEGPLVDGPVGEAAIGGPFTLTDQDGQTVTEASYEGRYLLIYFGFTYCPDICPTALLSMARALDQLGPDLEQIQPLFITVDPERDTAEAMGRYVSAFHPALVGLTGTADQIEEVANAYKVYYAKAPRTGSEATDKDYLVDHSSIMYLMAPDGRYLTHFTHQTDPEAIVAGIKQYVR